MTRPYTPLRYPGGKGRLAGYIADVMRLNNLEGGTYIEPYCGGAGIAIELLLERKVGHIHLNDLNDSIYAFWHAVLYQPDELCCLIEESPVNMDTWYTQKDIQSRPEGKSYLELGFSTFFLNRVNRSGIIFNAGVIGGKKQTGKWKIDARYYKESLIARIEAISRFSRYISLTNMDASDFVSILLPEMPKDSLVYFDPPYFMKGQGLYQNHYTPVDHREIARLIQGPMKQSWLVSYDNVPEIHKLYNKRRNLEFSLNYSANIKYKGTEIMFFKDGLTVPDRESPTRSAA
ncbi:MAG: DNA adenine methylase [Rhodospirillales bacterium]|nr:DNA adenine methylase [Rhodospirillales bacterium]